MAVQKKIVVLGLVAVVVLLATSVMALIISSRTIPSHGHIRGINVALYQDVSCAQPLLAIDWGEFDNGTSSTQTIYVKNEGTSNMTLNLSNNTWVPSNAPDYVTLTWNRQGYLLTNGTSVAADLTLAVSPTFTNGTDFSFNIVITGTQQ